MPDPADKSDDLISELAKLMATPPQPASVQSLRPVAVDPVPVGPSPAPIPVVRIPGMDMARPIAAPAPAPVVIPASASAPQPEQRAPLTGSIRIPGMDQPVAASAPVGKFDLGRPPQAAMRAEPNLGGSIPSLSERIAARAAEADAQRAAPAPAPVGPPIRFPELRTVSENRSFAQGPSVIPVMPPSLPPLAVQPQQTQSGDFSFDFGFGGPTAAAPASMPVPQTSSDPIADLINADMHATPARPAPVIPVLRTAAPPRQAPAAPPAGARPMISAPVPLKPVTAAPRPTEGDRFAAAPSAGLNLRTTAAPRPLNRPAQARLPEPEPEIADEADPMAEIESLIGEAVRVELNPGPVRVQAAMPVSPRVQFEPEADVRHEIHSEPAPVVPPLATQFAPRRAGLRDEGHAAAEDAILEASAASGAPVSRVDPAMADEGTYRRLKVRSQRSVSSSSGMRQYVGMAVAGTLLLAAGLGLYWVLNMGRVQVSNGVSAPQLTADATPVKAKPDPAAKPVTDAANSPVLKQMEGVPQVPSAEQLVTTDQTAGQTNVAEANTPAADSGDNGLANRKVRTVTVRPDGTIVPGDDAVAGNEALAIDRPNVPLVPGSTAADTAASNSTQVAALPSGVGLPPAAIPDSQSSAAADAAASVADAQPVIDPTQVAPVPMSFPVRGARVTALALASTPKSSVNAVVGAQTPNGPINLLADNSALQPPPASAAPVAPAVADATATAPLAPAAGGAAAYVQIASSTSASDASAAVKSATARYGTIFGDSKLMVQQADLGAGKGMRWRVRLPVASFSDATNICSQIKAQGGDCFATNG